MAALARAALPVVAIVVFAATIAATIATAGSTLGYDYQAYLGAAQRLLDGQPLYDPAVDVAGGFAIYLYPPPFAVAFIPFALLPDAIGLAAWIGACIGMTVAGIWLMPVAREVRWVVLFLAAISWPVVYSIKLGQVGPLLLLLFAAGWRWLDAPRPLGGTMAAGALVKVQPALLFVWAALTARWRAVATGLAVIAAVCFFTLPVVGLQAWFDYVELLRRVSAPITTPHNMTAGAIAFQAGASETVASALQWVVIVGAVAAMLFAIGRRSAEVSYVVTVVVSQLLSPVLWDHYAMVLLLPTAFLLARGHWWAALIVIPTSLLFVGATPSFVYPAVFAVALLAPILLTTERRRAA